MRPTQPFDTSPFSFEYEEHAIGGKLVGVSQTLGFEESLRFQSELEYKDELKHMITQSLVSYMLENKLIEVTYKHEPILNTLTIRARAYVTPDSQIKILRMYKTK
jgi:hypothetical protein